MLLRKHKNYKKTFKDILPIDLSLLKCKFRFGFQLKHIYFNYEKTVANLQF